MLRKISAFVLFIIIVFFTSGCNLIANLYNSSSSISSSSSSSVSSSSSSSLYSSSSVSSSSSSSSNSITNYTVAFDSQGATTAASPAVITVTNPAKTVTTLPAAPAKTAYYFSGWYTAINGGGTQFTTNTIVASNITVYAFWTVPSSPSWEPSLTTYASFTASLVNGVVAPDGTTTAYSLNACGGGPNAYYVKQTLSLTVGQQYQFGYFAKAGSLDSFWFNSSDFSIGFNLATGTVSTNDPPTGSIVSWGITPITNGWYYCYATITVSNASTTYSIGCDNSAHWSYTSGGDNIYLWQGTY